MLTWLEFVDDFQRELIDLEARPAGIHSSCLQCGVLDPTFRCLNCFGPHLLCSSCIVTAVCI